MKKNSKKVNSTGKKSREEKPKKETRPVTAPCLWTNTTPPWYYHIKPEYLIDIDINEHDSYENNDVFDEFELQMQVMCVKVHNFFRAKHGCPPLVHDSGLSEFATVWADTLIKEIKLSYRPNNKYGENIFVYTVRNPKNAHTVSAEEAIKTWYSQRKDYIFDKEPRELKSGHFTQMIWKQTKRIGIGRAVDKKGRVIIVANYDPRGNYRGRFLENCPPPIEEAALQMNR